MEIGTVNEQVTVSATAAAVETGSSELGNVRPEQEIIDLPVNTRNFTQLVDLAPGVNNHGGNANNSTLQGYTGGVAPTGPSSTASRPNTWSTSSTASTAWIRMRRRIFFPNMDSIAEFKGPTSAAPASYGGAPSIINVTFKYGTNDLHAPAWEFVRHSYFDAKTSSIPTPSPSLPLNSISSAPISPGR